MTPAKKNNINYELSDCFNMLAFLSTATVSMLEDRDAYGSPEISGAQICFFHLQDRMKGVISAIEGDKP